jgi:lipoate---protein ligase
MERRILDLTLSTLAENLALDEALLLDAEAGNGGEVLRFWEWPTYAVVLGVSGRLHEEVDVAACNRDSVPIQRRASGGGTVLLGTGCLQYSLILDMTHNAALRDIRGSYQFILGQLIDALEPIAAVAREGISDLAKAGMKIAGSAQQRKQRYLLHHGTILHGFDVSSISRYIRLPTRQPAYRSDRAHESFVANLYANANELKTLTRRVWSGEVINKPLPLELIRQLLDDKYERADWVSRR